MKIRYLGHSAFLISGKDFSVVTDPHKGIGYELERVHADYCISSHDHFDHNNFDGVEADKVIEGSECGFFEISSFHDEVHGMKRGPNRIYKFSVEGIAFCHMGDLGEFLSQSLVEEIGDVDVLLIPVGGNYTIDWRTAKEYVAAINPKICIPMHYKTRRSRIDIDGVENFLKHMTCVEHMPVEIELEKDSLPTETNVYVMDSSAF